MIPLDFTLRIHSSSYKQRAPEEGRVIHLPKSCVSIYYNNNEDNSQKNHNQNNTFKVSSEKFVLIKSFLSEIFSVLDTFSCVHSYFRECFNLYKISSK